jgi:DNA-binding NarL/FixJ family response regulator
MTRIVIIEDHALVRQSLVRAVSAEPGFEVVADTGSGKDGVEVIKAMQPDVVLLDISLPDEDGLTVGATVKELLPQTGVIFLTMHEYEMSIRRALELGADGYVPKSATIEELLEAVRTVADGGSYLSPSIARRVMKMAAGRATTSPSDLTDRELEILELLMDGGRASDVAEKLFLSVKTVKNHLTNIYAKLGVSSAVQAIAEGHNRKLVAPK